MSKMNDMAQTIETLRNVAAALTDAANSLAEAFTGESAAEQSDEPAVPTASKPDITLEQVRAVLADNSRHGYTADVKALLRQHGADKLSEIAPSEYEALLAEAEALGNG